MRGRIPETIVEMEARVRVMRDRSIPKVTNPGEAQRILQLLDTDEQAAIREFRDYLKRTQPPEQLRLITHFNDDSMMLCGLHKARCAAEDVPMELRSISKRWLIAFGSETTDAGDVPA
jgi:hypothetical protein